MTNAITNQARNFASDERGTIAVIFALCSFVLVMVTGLAIDVGRTYQANNKIGAAIDAAALASAKGLRINNLNNAEVTSLAQKYFDLNMKGAGGDIAKIESFAVDIDRKKGSVGIKVAANVPMTFARVGGIEMIAMPKSAVAIFDSKDIEVGLQLDVTGSMGGRKIADLKRATKNLLDVLIPDSPTGQKVRVGFAPFSAGVNVGPYLKAVDGNRTSPNSCTYERLTSTNEKTDAAPVGPDAFKISADLPGAQPCPKAQIVPMTDDKNLLKSTVEGYNAEGSTAGQLGASWAWYLLSPNWSAIWPSSATPAPYNDGRTIKTVLLMTDGVYNTVGGVDKGSGSAEAIAVSKLSVEICNGMKAKGVIVYTVGFDLKSAGAYKDRVINTLTSCASEAAKFFRAENGDELETAFKAIAEDIVRLRLSK
jgi:Flp pilus assembly protein TadG